FDASVPEIFQTLGYGGRLVVAPAGPVGVREVARWIREHGIDGMDVPTAELEGLLEEKESIGSLKWLVCGGQALTQAVAMELERVLPGRAYNEYGPTETTVG